MTALVLYIVFAPIVGLSAGLFAAQGNFRATFFHAVLIFVALIVAAPRHPVDCGAPRASAAVVKLAGNFR